MMDKYKYFQNLPSVHEILNDKEMSKYCEEYDINLIKRSINKSLNFFRTFIDVVEMGYNDWTKEQFISQIIIDFKNYITEIENTHFNTLINATGVISHTNIGRSPINKDVIENSIKYLNSYVDMEYNTLTRERSDRNIPIKKLMKILVNAQDCIVVNNNAAALMLVSNTFCSNKNMLISRGEIVEIGDNFRLLDIISSANGKVKEVGSTNRTYINDYEDNIDENTSLIMKINKSNYEITGFTKDVNIKDLAKLCSNKDLILAEDLGSGNLIDFTKFNLHYERTVKDAVSDCDIVFFSTDKMLSSTQGSIICGKTDYIQKLRKNQMYRALRAGKTTISLICETLKLYLKKDLTKIPVVGYIAQSEEVLKQKCESIYSKIKDFYGDKSSIQKTLSYIGGGVSETLKKDSYSICISKIDVYDLFMYLNKKYIVPYINNNMLYIDVMCIDENDLEYISNHLVKYAKKELL